MTTIEAASLVGVWRNLAAAFRALGYLDAVWNDLDGWSVSPKTDNQKEFERLAAKAARVAGSEASWRMWLNLLRKQRGNFVASITVNITGRRRESATAGIIHDVCFRSAKYCTARARKLEAAQPKQSGEQANPSPQDIAAALNRTDRKGAVRLWQEMRRAINKDDAKAALYREAKQDRSEYYKWEKGQLPKDSAADRAITRVLTAGQH
jgi:hypothetical protein